MNNSTQPIRFFHRGQTVEVTGADTTRSVLDWLREDARCTGTKEGCNEGDCGACTVVIGELADTTSVPVDATTTVGGLRLQTVNACIQFLPTLNGKALFTVEDLKDQTASRTLHPVQQAMVECHGSQCGFCTPGFVMSLFALQKNSTAPDAHQTHEALAGNLCRCTGYRPILAAAERACSVQGGDQFDAREQATLAALSAIAPQQTGELNSGDKRCLLPLTLSDLADLYEACPQARLLAGGTDLALEVTQLHRPLPVMIYVGHVAEMKRIEFIEDRIEIGAAVTLTDAYCVLNAQYPDFGELLQRFASLQIRNQGTLGGNIGNASPIGDTPPLLIALGASLVLRKGNTCRSLPLEDYFIDYRVTARQEGEFIEKIVLPRATAARIFRAYKVSKRLDDDISAVCAAFNLTLDNGIVTAARIAFGGMAATPKRASACETVLIGNPFDSASVERACRALAEDFTPLSDFRASKEYRLLTAQNLLRKYALELQTPTFDTRVTAYV